MRAPASIVRFNSLPHFCTHSSTAMPSNVATIARGGRAEEDIGVAVEAFSRFSAIAKRSQAGRRRIG
jgi:hypothetical protein